MGSWALMFPTGAMMADGTMCVAPLHASSVPVVNVPIARAATTSVVVSPSGKERRSVPSMSMLLAGCPLPPAAGVSMAWLTRSALPAATRTVGRAEAQGVPSALVDDLSAAQKESSR
mmetsp:Transcript_4353/g.9427  ORF Transcript_4353/g.9427 Transcript_4353/m.9427 type:complete len:117 (+) Transcript_4353:146-496(+)